MNIHSPKATSSLQGWAETSPKQQAPQGHGHATGSSAGKGGKERKKTNPKPRFHGLRDLTTDAGVGSAQESGTTGEEKMLLVFLFCFVF